MRSCLSGVELGRMHFGLCIIPFALETVLYSTESIWSLRISQLFDIVVLVLAAHNEDIL